MAVCVYVTGHTSTYLLAYVGVDVCITHTPTHTALPVSKNSAGAAAEQLEDDRHPWTDYAFGKGI